MIGEDELRATLRERADETVAAPDLLAHVHVGIRRGRQQRAAALAAAALLVAAVAVPVAVANRSASPDPLRSAPADPLAGWSKPRLDAPTFPLTPGWTPRGLGDPQVRRVGAGVLLSYEGGSGGGTQVEVGPEPGSWGAGGDGADRATTVSGRPAQVRTLSADDQQGLNPGDRYVGVRWQLADGRWVQLTSTGSTEDEVLRFARGLRLQTLAVPSAPFSVAAAPAGLVLQTTSANHLCLVPPRLLADRAARGVCVTLRSLPEQGGPAPEGERLSVGGRPATLSGAEGAPITLTVPLSPDWFLTVDVDQRDVPLTREELVRFAEGVTVTG